MRSRAPGRAALLSAALLASACVDTFDGVDIQATFDPGVLGPTSLGGTPEPGQPPPDTYLTLYAIDLVYQLDDEGEVVIGEDGEPVVDRSFAYGLIDFTIVPAIDLDSPCFIEVENLEGRDFAGLHVTRLAEKLRDVTGINDPLQPPSGADDGDVIDILTADVRVSFLTSIQSDLRVVASTSTRRLPDVDTGCVGDGTDTSADLVPPPDCIDDESNARRLALCTDFWERNPDFYEGSDRAYADPLNGVFYGLVDGTNPKNESQLGGVEFQIDVDWADFEQLSINWQYQDRDGDGEPDFPDTLPPEERSPIGFHYLAGDQQIVKRGVISYSLRNRVNPAIAGEVTVLNDLGEDDVHF